MAHAEGPPRARWVWVVPGSSPDSARADRRLRATERCVHDVLRMLLATGWNAVRGRLRFAADTSGHGARVGNRCIGYSCSNSYVALHPITLTGVFFRRQLPISYSSDAARQPRLSRARAGCVCAGRGRLKAVRLRLLELSLRPWRARARALAMSSSHGNGMAARRASRGCTAVVAACRACGAADEACAVKMVLEASEVAHSVAYSRAET